MKFREKVKKFWEEYGDMVIGFGCIAGVVGFAAWALSGKDRSDESKTIYHEHYEPIVYYPYNYKSSYQKDKYEWDDDEYKDDWDKLSIAANYLDLKEGESYVISSKEGIADDDEAADIGNVYLTHYIDDVVVNPPEDDEDEEEDEDDEEEDEDEEIEENEFKITIPDDADDDVRELVKQFIDIVENGQIEITHF